VLSKTIDVVIAHEGLGCRSPRNPSPEFLQYLRRQGCLYVEKMLVKELKYKLYQALHQTGIRVVVRAEILPDGPKDHPTRDIYVYYPSLYGGMRNSRGIVKIRCSFLGQALCPTDSHQQDLLSYYTGTEKARLTSEGFKVRSISAMQCLLEKMLLLHELYRMEEPAFNKITGTARHLYDIVQLFELVSATTNKMDQSLLNRLRRHRNEWYNVPTTIIRGCTLKKLCFIPPLNLLGPLMDDYRKLRREVIFDHRWEFPILVGKIQQINERLNGTRWRKLREQPSNPAASPALTTKAKEVNIAPVTHMVHIEV